MIAAAAFLRASFRPNIGPRTGLSSTFQELIVGLDSDVLSWEVSNLLNHVDKLLPSTGARLHFTKPERQPIFAGDPKKAHFGASSATLYIDNFGVIFSARSFGQFGGIDCDLPIENEIVRCCDGYS